VPAKKKVASKHLYDQQSENYVKILKNPNPLVSIVTIMMTLFDQIFEEIIISMIS
jgi:hypothetical protein